LDLQEIIGADQHLVRRIVAWKLKAG
jgi:hypothetical protein